MTFRFFQRIETAMSIKLQCVIALHNKKTTVSSDRIMGELNVTVIKYGICSPAMTLPVPEQPIGPASLVICCKIRNDS